MLLLAVAPRAEALRCGRDLVSEGDPAYQVERACGEADWVRYYHSHHGLRGEVWHYNFGPNKLIRVMHFRNGRLRRIETAGHGFVEPDGTGSCRPSVVSRGMTAPELLQRCGEPVQREGGWIRHHLDRSTLSHRKRHHHFHEVFVEDWFYDFGSNYLARKVRLVDGVVDRIDTLD